MYLGIDAGGTHTDAVLIQNGILVASAKVLTCHENLLTSVREVLAKLPSEALSRVQRVTLGTTLAVNAIVQGRTQKVGLILSAGPGLSATRFAMGSHVHVVEGGLDHRGEEVTPLKLEPLRSTVREWQAQGLEAFAVVGKFSPRNPAHEQAMAALVPPHAGYVVQGHQLSGQLHFPRRIATAYYNAAVWRLHNDFLDAVAGALAHAHIHAPVFLLKADGGAIALSQSRQQPVQSILSGPAASVMGVMALGLEAEDALLLDIGGTTTDIALFAQGFPVLDRDGMRLQGPEASVAGARSTLVRALAFNTIGVGGDSALGVENGRVTVGPQRHGPAMAFGGAAPTLMDALIVAGHGVCGNVHAAEQGMSAWAVEHGLNAHDAAVQAVSVALETIATAVRALQTRVNAHPVYTLAALLEGKQVCPQKVWLVGGPADTLRALVQEKLGLPVCVPAHADVANAVGAALTLPTAALELFADTSRGVARVPLLDVRVPIPRGFSLREATDMAKKMLHDSLLPHNAHVGAIEVTEALLFATLDARGAGGKDMRVSCQLVPGIVECVTSL
ncbi:MAG: hydantoinase/oxoprolinase family protein [Desulfovibrionaceae bacterium]